MAKHPADDITIEDEEATMTALREKLTKRREELTTELEQVDTRLTRINRYFEEPAKPESRKQAAPRTSSGPRAPRGERQQTILDLLKDMPAGLTRADFIEKLNIKGNKQAEGSLSNALATMLKDGKLQKDGANYKAPAPS